MFLVKIADKLKTLKPFRNNTDNESVIDVNSFYDEPSPKKRSLTIIFLLAKILLVIGLMVLIYVSIQNLFFENKHDKQVVKTVKVALTDDHLKTGNTTNVRTQQIDLAKVYPFVMPSDDLFDNQNMQQNPTGSIAHLRNITSNLPSIPYYQYQNNYSRVDRNNLPTIPGAGTAAPTIKPQRIEGILTNPDGKNAAIIDGKIVSEGDSLNGNSISRIDNGGITFDNGDKISYGIH